MVAPEVPTGGLVGQAVFGHQADGQLLDAAGIQALGQGVIGQVDGEANAAGAAVMLGVANQEIDRMARARVPEVMQGTRGHRVASRAATAAGTPPSREVPAAPLDLGLGKILDAGDALGDIGKVFAWSRHSSFSVRK